LGGSWLRVAALQDSSSGSIRIVRRTRIPAARSFIALKRLLQNWRMKPDFLVLGSTGIWEPEDRSALMRSLKPLARSIYVLSDVEVAWAAALGQRGEGILVLAGTGSIVYGKDRRGHNVRVGGLGPLLGDEGSAFWIGREWLKTRPQTQALRLAHRPDTVRAVAALAKKALAQSGRSPFVKRIVERAIAHLLRQAESAARQLRFKKEIPIACHGGLFRNRRFRSAFEAALARSRLRWKRLAVREPAEVAAAKLALYPSCRKFL
jgi:N-acetylglucosamine kinase-like BadF-type ATPase